MGFLALSFLGAVLDKKQVGLVACSAVGLAFLVAFWALTDLMNLEPAERIGHVEVLYPWITSGKFHLDLSVLIDPLSVFMLMIITGVGFVIHVYSIGYMNDDPEYSRFMSYMNLFIFSMSVLVMAADFFFLIVGWALVGLASYLLIGFYSEKRSAVLAARKAFVMNVIGDVGMVVAAYVIFQNFGSLNYVDVFAKAPEMYLPNSDAILLITFLLLVGAFAKSAQIPLHTWLPDAMEGPTPVSALIHAATMVTAGVYLIARCSVLYELAPYTMYLIATVGGITAIFAATIGLVQNDIKRVIAYSTMSQLGYMFLAVGIGMFGLGMFHLMTHAFFKALLFLSAGSVIHGMSGEQDIRKMGGLMAIMPLTFISFLIGSLSLIGFPLTSGYFSKEAIIISAWHAPMGNIFFWGLAVVTAGLTGFYSFRIFFFAFMGKQKDPNAHPHESPVVMTLPLMILAFLSLIAGGLGHDVLEFLSPVFGGHVPPHHEDGLLEGITLTLGAVGVIAALGLYLTDEERVKFVKDMLLPVHEILYRKYYIDELYDFFLVQPTKAIGKFLEEKAERQGIDFVVDQVAEKVKETSEGLSQWQSGKVRVYALNMVGGAVMILMFLVFY